MDRAKPFCIAKRDVWEAYRQVKANRGAAGVDEQSLEDFDRDLSKNLYRIWNRMCSGSYFPPPVRRVDIPKGDSGGTRPLGFLPLHRSDRFLCSLPKPVPRSRHLHAGRRLDSKQVASNLCSRDRSADPVFDADCIRNDTSSVVHSRSSP